ncbi:MAG: hypothetical protein US40_C0012G0012 [Candidatus Roizmanbacteria bacterium GW2011_GWC2_37_13]|uniref:AtpZ/AtpI family protein n=1 Tax=Candidatus Roizmanbacteria bacterium GW2011_GWC2_37_13 TaxID=1618486 RepID=A0A0G0G4V5_9BACT|nr:MAG: hypothetical protein US38_C0008G0018 [Candidatus Roizmanbacteria bacterium GW2011_GWC1_37_12]KKQ25077.1 MAG: hypothetical protein US40_C0012G0012 [Candidatus Roizmanbacteria bacterium GW2011_GWC2_37_13]
MKKYYSFDKNLNLKHDREQKFLFPTNKLKKNNLLLANYANIGYYLVTPILFGVFLGLYLKKATGNEIFIIIGIVIGGISTFYNLIRMLKQ